MDKYTPIIQQYLKIKSQHEDKLLLFRVGDFYELFFNDAYDASKLLSLTLTSKGKDVPMAGFPVKSLNQHIIKLMNLNKKVAICEQVGLKKKNELIERAVVNTFTPGTFFHDSYLSSDNNNYITCIALLNGVYGIASLDVSTGCFFISRVDSKFDLYNEIDRINPVEILISDKANFINLLPKKIFVNSISHEKFNFDLAYNALNKFFGSLNIKHIDVAFFTSSLLSAGCLLDFVLNTRNNKLENVISIEVHGINSFLYLDHNARRNLELFKSLSDNDKDSLFYVIDKTSTLMGKRLLKNWLTYPVLSRCILNDRILSVSILKNNQNYLKIKSFLIKVSDLERILSKIVFFLAQPYDLKQLQISLSVLPYIKSELKTIGLIGLLEVVFHNMGVFDELVCLIERSIVDESISKFKDGDFIKSGFDKRLDNYKKNVRDLNFSLINYKNNEKMRLGISGFNILFLNNSYVIEIHKSECNKVDDKYKKIISGPRYSRYVTDELKNLERCFSESKSKVLDREKRIYNIILYKIKKKIFSIKNAARYISILDVLCSFAEQSSLFNWCEPELVDTNELEIKCGRHPVIEMKKKNFIPNDLFLNIDIKSLIITGANMSGKSTYMRQSAIIVLLSHIGSHVPASSAKIGIFDKIFTRIGAGDDLANSYSTFMLEMKEMADILSKATENSLILIDEIGRGTGYLDGKALAFSILKYLIEKNNSFFLFSTHFHDLHVICDFFKSINKIYFIVLDEAGELKFFYKFENGFSYKSFGIEVASMAGIPDDVISFAREKFMEFSTNFFLNDDFFKYNVFNNNMKKVLDFINKIDPDNLSPIDALKQLYILKDFLNNNK
ncbi:MAG TPA: DNA mismatch repair protein MutS [Candidatus Azoamicus sp.]